MNYSFIRAKKKLLFSTFDKIWFVLFAFGVALIFAVNLLYVTKISLTNSAINSKIEEMKMAKEKTTNLDLLFEKLLKQNGVAKDYYAQNLALKTSLKNLFDMVLKSDSITLESLSWQENSLQISGVSPTKEKFILLLETPLKSIFDETSTSYYKLENGWYRFVSVNKIGEWR